ncbi:MAG: PEGA domain-containing protein [Candidatus Latescibacter sp.]|nr:PEGA domain-containing protein [Candidatus Latescibacter sp.]
MYHKPLSFLAGILAAAIFLAASPISYAQSEKPYSIAIMKLKGMGISEIEAETLTETLYSGISEILVNQSAKLKEKYSLLERSQMDKILDQFKMQDALCSDDSCAVTFGRLLSVQLIIIGSVGLVGETYIISCRIVDVESSKVIRSASLRHQGKIDGVLDILPLVGHELLTGVRLPEPIKPMQRTLPGVSQPAAQPEISYLSIEGTPASAEARINGQSIGQTPVQYHALAPGRCTVVIANAGYEDFTKEIVIEPGKQHKLSYNLTAFGRLTFKGKPDGATVSIDGKEIGKTPLDDRELPQGSYTVTITRQGYTDFQQNISLSSGEKREIGYALAALVKIAVESRPNGAVVTIDGKNAGETPLRDFTVAEGVHEIALKRMGYETHREQVTVSPSTSLNISPVIIPKTKNKALLKSIVFPGSGQYYAEYKGKGAFISVLQIAALAGAVGATLSANDARKKYDDAYVTYKNAVIPGEIQTARTEMNAKYNKVSSTGTIQSILIGTAVAVYLYNIVDAIFTVPKIEVKPPKNTWNIEPGIKYNFSGLYAIARF